MLIVVVVVVVAVVGAKILSIVDSIQDHPQSSTFSMPNGWMTASSESRIVLVGWSVCRFSLAAEHHQQ